MKANTTDRRKLNDFIFEISPRDEESESVETRSDFILRSGEKEINALLHRKDLNLISLRCVDRFDLDFNFSFLIEHDNEVDIFIFGMTSINIQTLDGNNTIEIFLYVIGNMKEDLVLGHRECWELGLKDFFRPVLSCPEDNEDF